MKLKSHFKISALIFIFISSIFNCNEQFTSYNYTAPPLVKITRIRGSLLDKYSGEPIHPATININGQETTTDEYGNYQLNYVIPDDVEPNQQEIGYLNILAWDYLPYYSTFIIYPIENKIDVLLEYSPPTIIDAVSHVDTTQAIIRDYQGVDDIKYVSVTHKEYRFGAWIKREFEMSKVSKINEFSAYYEFVDTEGQLNLSILSDWYRITARDKSDNVSRDDFTISPDSSLIF